VEVIEIEQPIVLKPMATKKEPEQKGTFAQAGGHTGAFVQAEKGKIMKKVCKKELDFYSTEISQQKELIPFIPQFFGTQNKDGAAYVVIEDLTAGFEKPCILDVKMGTSSVGEDATPEKMKSMGDKDKNTTTAVLGLRITAMRVYHATTGEFTVYPKTWGKKVKESEMKDSLRKYFDNGKEVRTDLIPQFLQILEKINAYFQKQKKSRFYSSSLLLIYDGKSKKGEAAKVCLKIIDFAHVHPIKDGGRDEGYVVGLKNLIVLLKSLQ